MITLACTHCGKPLIVPDNRARKWMHCPNCGEELRVPEPLRPPRASRTPWWLLVPVVGVVGVGATLAAIWILEAGRPAAIRARFAERLSTDTAQWRGIHWQECNPRRDKYQVHVFSVGESGTYEFDVVYWKATAQSFIHANPKREWLAYAIYHGGVQDFFEYRGADPMERSTLQDLTTVLDDAIRYAVQE